MPMETDRKSGNEDPGQGSAKSGPNLMLIGTACVIGAVAANVVGFHYSRWATGKELYRAWERYSANVRSSKMRQSHGWPSSARGRGAAESDHGSTRTPFTSYREQFETGSDRQTSKNPDREHDRQRVEHASRGAGKQGGHGSSNKHQSASSSGSSYRQSFRIDFDPALLDEILRSISRGRVQRGRGLGLGMDPRVLEELLRAAQASHFSSQKARPGRDQGFGNFEFWDEVFGSSNDKASTGSGRHRSGFGAGTYGSGMHEGFGGLGSRQQAYAVLGLPNGASSADIKKAYRNEVLRWHPDKYQGQDREGASRKFREVTSAYETLTKANGI
jgi:DnaJ-domain-containing protein 1